MFGENEHLLVGRVRSIIQPWTTTFSLEQVYALADSEAHKFPLHENVEARHGVMRRMLQDERRKNGLIFIREGLYKYPQPAKDCGDPLASYNPQRTTTMQTESHATAFQAAFARAQAKAVKAPDKVIKVEKRGFTEDNVVSVASMLQRKTETFTVPTTGQEVEIAWMQFRPSDFVANIASVKDPGAGYQRRPADRMAKLNAMARAFKPYLLAPFDAWINEDGLPELLDALGRTFVCLHKIDPPYNKPVMTRVHLDVKNRQQAAVRFRELNSPLTTKVGVKGIFLSRLAEGDTLASHINTAARDGGLVVGSGGRDGISVQAAEALHQMGVLKEVGLLKTNGEWKHKLANPYYVGLGGYLLATSDNGQILREMMRATSVQSVVKEMHELYDASTPHARITAARFARALLSLRNYKRTHNRVTPNWGRVDEAMAEMPFNDRWGAIKE